MDINKLMIGDWVYNTHHKKNIKITPYDFFAHGHLNGHQYIMGPGTPCLGRDLEPIPLTPEILEKNGFEKLDFSHFQIGDRRLVLDADGRWGGPLSWHWVVTEMSTNAKGQPVVLDYYVATINYVHELQHALRICRIDKEIIL